MQIVNAKQVAKAIKVDKFGAFGTFIGWVFMKVTRISKLNKIYTKSYDSDTIKFLGKLVNEFGVSYDIPTDDLKRLPKTGPYITVSNHPLGGLDGILLMKIMLEHDPEFKIIGNFLLQEIEPLKPIIMPVNPFDDMKDVKSSVMGLKETLRHLSDGKPLGIFPAGEVSTIEDGSIMLDKPWEPTAMKIIQKANVPVVPIYFHTKNSKLFYWLAKINPILRTLKLPSELLTQRKKVIKIRIGKSISVNEQNEHKESLEQYTDFLRKKTYILSKSFNEQDEKKLLGSINLDMLTKTTETKPKQIARAANQDKILEEIAKLRENLAENRFLQSKSYEVFFVQAEKIPNILHEIGRLREITFREIGEGTNESIDLDKFDRYYYHMFLWDEDQQRVAGAYRMGLGSEIFPKYGIDGFYMQELFKFEPELHKMMSESIEMGRAFIVPDYQLKPMPLFLLWKGIVHTTLRYPQHKFLIGGVSISNQFTDFSKSLMIEFMKSHYYDPYVAQYIRPKMEYKVKLKDADKDFVFNETEADLNKFDKIIDEVEPGNLRLPVLIKKYIKQNARVVAFNVDPLFNNSVDGLMYIRIEDLPESTVKPVMEEFQAELERRAEK
ncbi:lysophospholipid acyltransferase family protein [Paenimyroides tangerinum]|uniref:Lysophospholipid acyltransferase family protein n=1 Tax=Paenimyroides tangerinum TaxID=2488728 RepID=A0A3P3W5U8_9FLAO|nr:lysophospholipid acyltransferase family protein [Paenimyroides tangerinum]RRJ89009.1 lysophospholipid acyltransferase family protein [Paenimyroides tangerinum]